MKERDVVDFEKLKETNPEMFDENGEFENCRICYTHELMYEKVEEKVETIPIPVPRCPKCGKPLTRGSFGYDNAVVGESNTPTPDGEIGYYPIYECEDCDEIYSLMPIRTSYNGNHNIFYTGGKDYLYDDDMKAVSKEIYDAVMPSIKNYIERKLNPQCDYDKKFLNERNIEWWVDGHIEGVIAKIMYEHGFKK